MNIAIRLDAGHDRNGNPRRVFVVLDERGDIVEAIDEEYYGVGALTRAYPGINDPATFATTPAEYRNLVKNFSGDEDE